MIRFCLLAACLCGPLAADGLADLKAALARCQGQDVMKAQLESSTWSRKTEDKQPKETTSSQTLIVEGGSMGLRITYPPAVLAKARQLARGRDPKDQSQPLGQIGFQQIEAMCSAAPSLQEKLEESPFQAEQQALWQGHPARLLLFNLKSRKESQMGAKMDTSGTWKLWIDAEGVPLASEAQEHFDLGVLVFKAKGTERTMIEYTRLGSRLVVLRQVEEKDGTAMGQSIQSKVVLALKLQ